MVKEDGDHLGYILIYVTRVIDLGTNLCYYRLRCTVDSVLTIGSIFRASTAHFDCGGARQVGGDKVHRSFHWLASITSTWLAQFGSHSKVSSTVYLIPELNAGLVPST